MNEDLIGPAEQFCGDVDKDGKPVDDDGDGLADADDPDCKINAIGEFTATDPDTSDMCKVNTVTQHIVFPGLTFPSDPSQYDLVTDPDIGTKIAACFQAYSAAVINSSPCTGVRAS